jgi:hypothetical protein
MQRPAAWSAMCPCRIFLGVDTLRDDRMRVLDEA